ncbi:RHS repeat-associated core domain-containing protein, partial [Myxococcus fulvus]|uniref:RHS repeat-associated core domain-containing protein n=1 Tax=Myxococcus fulvus TaxID=33 RepID=UPI003B99015B
MAVSTGKLTDHLQVDPGGCASYSIELKVPPGTQGLEPHLAVAYNSGGDDGLLGVGFGLSGLSSITRTGRTLAQDGAHGAVSYDLDDRFALDGQRLMVVSGAYGQTQAIYHTEIQTWRKVVPNYPAGWDVQNGPHSFTVHTRDGQTWEYGATEDSRVPASSTTPAIRLWSLNRVTDRHGNFMTVTYDVDAQNNAHTPKLIDYTDNTKSPIEKKRQVRFTFIDRQLVTTTYLGGHPIRNTRLLSQVQTFVDGALVRTYRLTYQPSHATGRPLLQSVATEARGTALPPTTFTWQGQRDQTPTLLQASRALGKTLRGGQKFPIDVNGNGRTDLLHAYPVNLRLRMDLYFSTGSDLDGPHPVDLGGAELLWGGTFCPLDVDADGRMDLVYAVNNGGKLGLTLFKSIRRDGRITLVREGAVNGAGPDNLLWGGRLLALDADGDGRSDLVYATDSGSRLKLDVLYSNGSTFAPSASGPSSTTLPFGGRILPLDLDGSGQTDLVHASEKAGFVELTWLKAQPDRKGYLQQGTPLLPSDARIPWTGSLIPIHLNGDGQVDLVNPYTDGKTLHLRLLYNTGKGFVVRDLGNTGLVYGTAIPQLMPADVTGNGRDDLVVIGDHRRGTPAQKSRIAVFVNEGGTLRHHAKVSPLAAAVAVGESVSALGLSGVGRADLLHVDGFGAVHLLAATAEHPDLLASITNGLGGRFELTYKPITDDSVYRPEAPDSDEEALVDPQALFNNQLPGATYALAANPRAQADAVGMTFASRSIQYPRYVVTSYTQAYSQTQRYTHDFTYAGARLSLRGRGWLGFASWNKKDPQTGPHGILTETLYHQEFPLTYTVKSQTVRRASDQAFMSRVEYTYNTPSDSGVRQIQTSTILRKLYSFADSDTPDCTRLSTFQFDEFGNTVLITHRNSEAPTDVLHTRQVYENNVELHRFGFLKELRLSADAAGNQTLGWERMTHDETTWDVKTHSRWTSGDTWQVYTYAYDAWGNPTSTQLPGQGVIAESYDADFHTFLGKRVLPAPTPGRTLQLEFQHDATTGVMTSQTNPNGAREEHQYDGLGRPTESRRTGPDGSLVTTTRFEHGQDSTGPYHQSLARQEWSGDVWAIRTDYLDGFGRVTRMATQGQENGSLVGRAILEDTVLDANDLLMQQTLPYFSGDTPIQAQTCVHDEYMRVVRQETPGEGGTPNVTTYEYPHVNRVVITEGATSPAPRIRKMAYRYHGDTRTLDLLEDSQGHTTRFTHDLLGRRLSAMDPKVETTFAYDGVGRHTAISTRSGTALFTQESYAYQDEQRSWTHTDGTGLVTTFQHDALMRRTSKQVGSERTDYTYDDPARPLSLSHLTGVKLPDGTTYAYGHDADGNTSSITLTVDGTAYPLAQDFTPERLVSRVVHPDAARTEVRYQRDALQRLLEINEGTTKHLLQSDFTALGAPAVARYGNTVRTAWTYTPDGHLLTQDVFNKEERPVSASTLAWTPFWQVASLQDRLEAPRSQSLSYDPLGQLVKAEGGAYGLQEFTYDGARNLTRRADLSLERSGHRISGGSLPSKPNALETRYDDNGSLVQLRYDTVTYRYTYDGEHRLQTVHQRLPDDRARGLQDRELMRFTYDHDGRRLKKVEAEMTTYYVAPCYEVVVFANGARQHTRSIFDGGHLVATVTTLESGTRPSTAPAGVPTPGTRYFHVNNVQSTTLVTDDQGQVSCAVDYDPFGKPVRISGNDDFRRKYTGLELDASNLYYASSRYYSPLLGGFITADTMLGAPEEQAGAFNRYAYVLNDPMTLSDPSGFGLFSWIGSLFSSVVSGISKAIDRVANFFTNTVKPWFEKHWQEIVSYTVDVLLVIGGVALCFIPGLQGAAAALMTIGVGALVGAGLGGLAYNITTSLKGETFEWGKWGTQLGIGALTGAIAGGFSAGGTAIAAGLGLAARTAGNIGVNVLANGIGGAVSNTLGQFLGN